jgi:hypothetical protein
VDALLLRLFRFILHWSCCTKMKKLFLAFLLLLCLSISVQAQNTTVSATVTDSGSVVWANGTYAFTFVPSPRLANGPYFNNGSPFTPTTISGSLNGSGAFSVSVPSNSTITPSGTTWTVTYCPQATNPCQTSGPITISGASQSITSSFVPSSLVIAPGNGILVYSTAEVPAASLGSQVYLIGTGLQICTAVTGNICNTWSSSSSGGGSTPVTTLPTTCTAGQSFQLPNGAIVTCGPSANQFTSSSQNFINVAALGVAMSWKVCTDGSWSNSSSQLTSAGQCTWTSADLGKFIFATLACQSGLPPTTLELNDVATIATITSAHVIQVTGATTTGAVASGGCIEYGLNEETGWSAVDTAIAASTICPYVFIPTGFSAWIHSHLFTQAPACPSTNGGFGFSEQGLVVAGAGRGVSQIIIRPSFVFSTECTHGTGTACIVQPIASLWHDFAFNGWGNDHTGGGDSSILFQTSNYSSGYKLGFYNLASNDGTVVGFNISGCCDNRYSDTSVDGWGRQNLVNSNTNNVFGAILTNFLACDGLGGSALPLAVNNGFLITYQFESCGNQGSVTGQQYVQNAGTWKWYGGSTFPNGSTTNNSGILNTGTMWIDGADLQGETPGYGINQQGTLYLTNTTFNGTGGSIFQETSATSITVDQCGNVYTVGLPAVTTGQFVGEACSANKVGITAAKLVLSSGWGSTAANTALTGADFPIQFTVTNSGTGQAASPTITYTFPTPLTVAPFSCTAIQTGGSNAIGTFTSSALSATGVTFTYSLTPTASDTEIVNVTCVTP